MSSRKEGRNCRAVLVKIIDPKKHIGHFITINIMDNSSVVWQKMVVILPK